MQMVQLLEDSIPPDIHLDFSLVCHALRDRCKAWLLRARARRTLRAVVRRLAVAARVRARLRRRYADAGAWGC